ncbi:uncharacterized protein [Lepeophtheirus salmonis]|uniref:uncharacterized protein n=1 Tax=Lepeophtheirus salmonis TaxID=72036 RepID=UPI001AE6362B|nr:uncharacterized protein LOC121119796 [Lepeophtheirus salmonis]
MWGFIAVLLPFHILLNPLPIHAVNIQSVSISGVGETPEKPVNEGTGDEAVLRCEISGTWDTCRWKHTFVKENTDTQSLFYCSIIQGTASNTCDPENVDTDYKRRIKIEAKSSSCELKISNPNYLDSGEWECYVSGGAESNFIRGTTEIFVSRRAELYISEPDMETNSNQYIVLDMASSRPKLYAKCRAYHAIPYPQFRWYVNEVNPRNEIKGQDAQISLRPPRTDSRGQYTEGSLDWGPKDLCQNYNIEADLCKKEEFEFDLLCIIDQAEYYMAENEDNVQRVTTRVIGNSSRRIIASGIMILVVSCFVAFF